MRTWGAMTVGAPVLGLALLLVACGSGPTTMPTASPAATPDWRREIRVQPDEALGIAQAFVGHPLLGAKAELMEPGALNTAYLVDAPPWNLYVDAFAGRVFFAFLSDVSTAPGPLIGEAEATARATAFLVERAVPIPAGDPAARLVDRGSGQTWEVTWQARSGQAFAPDTRRVELEAASGTVTGYLDRRLPYRPAPAPIVTAAQAAAKAKIAAGSQDGVVESTELWIWFDAAGSQVLIWRVQVGNAPDDAYGGHGMVDVDAISGDTVAAAQG